MPTGTDRPTDAERGHTDCLDDLLTDLVTRDWKAIREEDMTRALIEVCTVIQALPEPADRRWWINELRQALETAYPEAKPFSADVRTNLDYLLKTATDGYLTWRQRYAPPLPTTKGR